ncbi:hypothetical protein CASFOL_040055 [Castilleja foliolosa]|uniref:Transcription repressor n=1 Tax=Castilleja foliolosa TaxID=1961234 RepID=A0ABD3BFD2_9LAMI
MGNYRFRFSDMIPNAWFYKLKYMSKPNKKPNYKPPFKQSQAQSYSSSSSLPLAPPPNTEITKLPQLSDQRKSYYIPRDINITTHPNSPVKTSTISVSDKPDFTTRAEPPRKSSRRRRSTKRSRQLYSRQPAQVGSTISAGCSCRATLESVWTKPSDQTISSSDENGSTMTEYGSDRGLAPDEALEDVLASCRKCQTGNDVVIKHTEYDVVKKPPIINFDSQNLAPIITKKQANHKAAKPPGKIEYGKSSSLSPGLKLRTNTAKIANRRINQGRRVQAGRSRRSMSESVAVVKKSEDPGRDFRESMVEMIVENNIRASKDLEELLACYLSLNSDEYHEIIIDVFKQIWFDFIRFRVKS